MNKYSSTIRRVSRIIGRFTGKAHRLEAKAFCFLYEGKEYEKALEYLLEAREIDESFWHAGAHNINIAIAYLGVNNRKLAMEHFIKGYEIVGNNLSAYASLSVWLSIGLDKYAQLLENDGDNMAAQKVRKSIEEISRLDKKALHGTL